MSYDPEAELSKAQVEKERDALRVALHDIFELASRQKSNRGWTTDEGLISTTLASVRILRRLADELEQERNTQQLRSEDTSKRVKKAQALLVAIDNYFRMD